MGYSFKKQTLGASRANKLEIFKYYFISPRLFATLKKPLRVQPKPV